jgi:hypothetical protein
MLYYTSKKELSMARAQSMVEVVRDPEFITDIEADIKQQVRATRLRVSHQRLGEVSLGLLNELGLEVDGVSYAGYPIDEYDYRKGEFGATPYYTVAPENTRGIKTGWRLARYRGKAFRSETDLVVVEKVPMDQTEKPTIPRPDTGIVIPLHSHNPRSRWDEWSVSYEDKLQSIAAVELDLVAFADAVHEDRTRTAS